MNDAQRGEYLRMLDAEAKRHARAVRERELWALERHMSPIELALSRAWRWIRRVGSRS